MKDAQSIAAFATLPLVTDTAPSSNPVFAVSVPPRSRRSAPEGIAFVQPARSVPSSTVTAPPNVLVAASTSSPDPRLTRPPAAELAASVAVPVKRFVAPRPPSNVTVGALV